MFQWINIVLDDVDTSQLLNGDIDWEIVRERLRFYLEFLDLIRDWKDTVPNLRKMFQQDEIDCLLEMAQKRGSIEIVRFVLSTGYRDVPVRDKNGEPLVHRITPLHSAGKGSYYEMVSCLFKIYNRVDVNYTDEDGFSHFHVACRFGLADIVKKFLDLAGQDPNCLDRKNSYSPLHFALLGKRDKKVIELLLRRGADPNIADKNRLTALHIICHRRGGNDELANIFFNVNDDINQTVRVDAQDKYGNTPLHNTMDAKNKKMAELLLRRGADPNLATNDRLTPLHLICMKAGDHYDTVEMLIEVSEQENNKVRIDAQSEMGDTPLIIALINNNMKIAELLLRRGADPTIANVKYGTALHYIASSPTDLGDFLKKFFKIIDEQQWPVQIDALFNRRLTPLHSAVFRRHKKLVEVLLRRGADPNIPSEREGFTALHFICSKFYDDDLVQLLFKLCGSRRRQKHRVAIDARDNFGRTPLQMAVANLLPDLVDVLLDNGADLSRFVMPDAVNFCNGYDHIDQKWDKLRFAYSALAVVERLEKRGYLLVRRDAIKIMTFFAEQKLFEESSDFEKCLRDDEEFTNIAKEIIITSSLSLYDLILLRPKQAGKRLTYKDYMGIERTDNLDKIPKKYRDACMAHLCEKMSRGYFKRWALNSFLELIHYRLPILCCDMIIEHLSNEDLLRIYQAAEIVTKRSAAETYETHARKRRRTV